MKQQSKQVSAVTGHHCAEKQIESELLAKRIAKFLKNGGAIKAMRADSKINQKLIHGTRHAYVVTQCRCGLCIQWSNKQRVTKGEVA